MFDISNIYILYSIFAFDENLTNEVPADAILRGSFCHFSRVQDHLLVKLLFPLRLNLT